MNAMSVTERPDFKAMRHAMVESQLRVSDVTHPAVIAAMARTPREQFVPVSRMTTCYMDRAVALGDGRVLNPPLASGLMLDRAQPQQGDNVLIVNAPTGYLAALVASMVDKLVVLDEDEAPVLALDNALAVKGPLAKGYAKGAPYSLILIDGAVEAVPDTLIAQLAEGGRLVSGVTTGGVTGLAIGRKQGKSFGLTRFADTDIAPLPQFAAPRQYRF